MTLHSFWVQPETQAPLWNRSVEGYRSSIFHALCWPSSPEKYHCPWNLWKLYVTFCGHAFAVVSWYIRGIDWLHSGIADFIRNSLWAAIWERWNYLQCPSADTLGVRILSVWSLGQHICISVWELFSTTEAPIAQASLAFTASSKKARRVTCTDLGHSEERSKIHASSLWWSVDSFIKLWRSVP